MGARQGSERRRIVGAIARFWLCVPRSNCAIVREGHPNRKARSRRRRSSGRPTPRRRTLQRRARSSAALHVTLERFSIALMAMETAFGGSHFVRQRSNHSLGLRPTLASLAPEGRSRGLPGAGFHAVSTIHATENRSKRSRNEDLFAGDGRDGSRCRRRLDLTVPLGAPSRHRPRRRDTVPIRRAGRCDRAPGSRLRLEHERSRFVTST